MSDWMKVAQARCAAATPGPWTATERPPGKVSINPPGYTGNNQEAQVVADGAFIAAARVDLPRALDVIAAADVLSRFAWHLASCTGRDLGEDGQGEGPKGRPCSCGYSAACATYEEQRR